MGALIGLFWQCLTKGVILGALVGLFWQCLTKGLLWGFWLDSLLINKRNPVSGFRTLSEFASVSPTIRRCLIQGKSLELILQKMLLPLEDIPRGGGNVFNFFSSLDSSGSRL